MKINFGRGCIETVVFAIFKAPRPGVPQLLQGLNYLIPKVPNLEYVTEAELILRRTV